MSIFRVAGKLAAPPKPGLRHQHALPGSPPVRQAQGERKSVAFLDTAYAHLRSDEEIEETRRLRSLMPPNHWLRDMTDPTVGIARIPQDRILWPITQFTGDYELNWRESLLCTLLLGQIEPPAKQLDSCVRMLCNALEGSHGKRSRISLRMSHTYKRTVKLAVLTGTLTWAFLLAQALMMGSEERIPIAFLSWAVISMAGSVGFVPLVTPVSMTLDAQRGARIRAAVARALGRWKQPRSIGSLAIAARDVSPLVRAEALRAIPEVLPYVTESQYGRLPQEAVPALCRLLHHQPFGLDTTERWRADIIAALERAGDGRAVAPLEEVAAHSAVPELRAAASHALPILRERKRLEESRQTLLRGADAPELVGEMLLHPVADRDPNPQELLRPQV